jgi:hypothetical protein
MNTFHNDSQFKMATKTRKCLGLTSGQHLHNRVNNGVKLVNIIHKVTPIFTLLSFHPQAPLSVVSTK